MSKMTIYTKGTFKKVENPAIVDVKIVENPSMVEKPK